MKVLIATDASPASELVLAEAAARPWPSGTTFSVVNVVDLHHFAGIPALMDESKHKMEQVAAVLLQGTQKLAHACYHAEHHIITGFPRRAVSEHAKEWRADLGGGWFSRGRTHMR